MKERLSKAERNVVACASLGDTAEETAARLGVSVETVKTQRRVAREKLRARSMAHGVAIAIRTGQIA